MAKKPNQSGTGSSIERDTLQHVTAAQGPLRRLRGRPILSGLVLGALAAGLALPAVGQNAGVPGKVSAGAVDAARVLAEATRGDNWLVNGRDFGSSHFSPLRDITDQNIENIGLAWSADIDSAVGMATEPIVVDGIIYVTGSLNRVFAIDATSGRQLWKYDPKIRLDQGMMGSYTARIPRGVAVWEGKVFLGTGDCRMIAIDAQSGEQLWDKAVCDPNQTGITGAPRVGGGKVYIGYFGSDTGTRGAIVALDANSGDLAWRFWNTPGNPAEGFESKAHEMAAKTWAGDEWWKGGGGAAWESIVYDESTGLLIYSTAGPSTGLGGVIETSGDRLFSSAVVALNADTGEYAWHYQPGTVLPENPPTEVFHVIVTDLMIEGAKRRVVMTMPRWGGFFVIDAKNGELISWKSLADRPAEQKGPPTSDGHMRNMVGKNWWPMSYSSLTGLVYVPVYESSSNSHQHGLAAGGIGQLIAWDPVKQAAKWSVAQRLPINGGVLSTAGNLVFQGEATGEFAAYEAGTGRKLWSIDTGSAIQGVPVTYRVKGEQYILIPVGLGSGTLLFDGASGLSTLKSRYGPSRLLAFKLGAKAPFPYPEVVVPRVPEPPVQRASAEMIKQGGEVMTKFTCWGCHGGFELDGVGAWVKNGAVPDLRYMPKYAHDLFLGIVMGGSRRQQGMPGFADGHVNWPIADQMTVGEARALHAFLIDLQWKAYREDQKRLAGEQSSTGTH
ncbi:PQQ-binding-like beta-propeller repeat protein [Altererythrobacter soli]|uniref:PQQ-binding-like beta-propeller repeat protein n=1 Tax=Croceibacterium soli TaxID=1739690 RepID=A0A6I4UWV9_9SPHN|nr:PQQ-binding-like beta-propeller repeat protein [Croceibacterium soli]MXP42043.1 PQQ-binding-like beta-propeller repeat protein [Croceibacterium soli]